MCWGFVDLTVRDLSVIDVSSLMECTSPCFQILLIFVLDYLAQLHPASFVTSAAVKPTLRSPFSCRSIAHQASILHGNSWRCWATGGEVLLHMANTNENPEPTGPVIYFRCDVWKQYSSPVN